MGREPEGRKGRGGGLVNRLGITREGDELS